MYACRPLVFYARFVMTMATTWSLRTRTLDITIPRIMGIVNVTPDSFSDGGLHATREAATAFARQLVSEGADIIDVGGESTRPGAADVSEAEELDRVIGVVETLASEGIIVSVDTSKAAVMREAVKAGAEILNDIRAFQEPDADTVAADSGAGLVVMHMQGTPRTMQAAPHYDDVVQEAKEFLLERQAHLLSLGAFEEKICFDPGFGFGKNVEQNFALLAATEEFAQLGRPYLMALSRKSSIGAVTGVEKAAERVTGSVAGALLAVERGAQLVRVHDVKATREALDVWLAVKNARAA